MSTDAEKTVQCIEETLLAYCRQQGLFKSGRQSHCSLLRVEQTLWLCCFFCFGGAKDLAIEVLATHVNHGIRGASARADAQLCHGVLPPGTG